jgi:hypothetical protein
MRSDQYASYSAERKSEFKSYLSIMQTAATKGGRGVRVLIEQGFLISTDTNCAKLATAIAQTKESTLSRICQASFH